jgi:hypothetical protein
MCQRVQCRSCGKPTYAGCGNHIEQVLGNVPPAERCRCREERAAAGIAEPSLLKRLFGLS